MKTNKIVWKIVSVVLTLAMVITLMPANIVNNKQDVEAAKTVYEYMTENFESSPTLTAITATSSNPASGEWSYSSNSATNAKKITATYSTEYYSEGAQSLCFTNTGTVGINTFLVTLLEGLEYGIEYTISYDVLAVGSYSGSAFAWESTTDYTCTSTVSGKIASSEATVDGASESWTTVTGSWTETDPDTTDDVTTYSTYAGIYLASGLTKKQPVYVDNIVISYTEDDQEYVTIVDGLDIGSFESYSDWHWGTSVSSASISNLNFAVDSSNWGTAVDGDMVAHYSVTGSGNYAYATTTVNCLPAGDYVATFYGKGATSNIGIIAFDEEGNQILMVEGKDCSKTSSISTWDWGDQVTVKFSLEQDYYWADVGVYAMATSSANAWGNIDCFDLQGPASVATARIYTDQTSNGDFEKGDIRGWTIENCMDDTSGSWHYAYTVKNGALDESQLNDTYYLDWYNSGDNGSTDIYELIMYENIQVTEAGTYYLWGETMGEWASGELLLEAYEYESGNNIVSMNLDASGSWCDWAYAYSAGFELEAGDIIQFYFIMQATPDNSPYGDIDNLKLVKAEDLANTIADFNERQAPDKTDKFANGSFGKYGFDYWDNVTGDNDTVNYAYGYAFPGYGNGAEIVYDSAGAEVTASSTYDGCLNVYSNSETVNYTLSFEQDDIIITRPGDYTIGCFLKGYLGDDGTTTDAGIFIVVTDSEGNELCNSQVTPYSNEEWTEAKSDVFTMDAAGTINVTINVKLPYSHEETAEDETTFTCNPSVMFDDFTIEEPDADVSVANANELGYEGVTYRNAEGDVIYANGGNTIKGVDVSSVISLENAGITFKNEAGEEEDLFQILADNGVNYIRCRVWNNPFDSNGNGFGGGNCDVSVLTAIAERCANAGLSLYIDFHYSDFWADPSSQVVPAAWSGYNVTEKAAALASFTTETLTTVAATGVNIGIVSLGNETNNGRMAGEITVNNFITLANAGSAAVRAFDPDIMIALHFAPTEGGWLVWEYKTLRLRKVDFDIFAASCYPYYESHSSDGTIKTIVSELNNIANKYHKLTMIAEYDWPYTWTDYDGYYTGQIKSTDGLNMNWDVSTEGQGNMIKDIITATCNASSGYTTETEDDDTTIVDYGIANCVGSFYWEGAWVGLADSTAWDTYGIGVYSAAGAVEKGWGTSGVGTVHEILSFFDENATATSAIQSFATVTDTHPIDVALVQTSSVSDGTYNLRMVGTVSENCLAWSDGSNIGFRVIVYDADGNVVKSLSDKVTTKVYSSVLANGEAVTPGEGKYFYTYAFRNIPEGTTYYFKIMSNADDSWSYHQRAAKTVKVLDGTATVVDSNTFAEIE